MEREGAFERLFVGTLFCARFFKIWHPSALVALVLVPPVIAVGRFA